MSTTATPPAPPARGDLLRRHVTERVEELQRAYLGSHHHRNSWATGALAHLRRAVGASPGADPAVWSLVYDGFPPRLVGGEDGQGAAALSSVERAAHAALALYAVHQQSRREPMHRRGERLGSAVRQLATKTQAEGAVLRRFHALGTAQGLDEALHHARGLVTQLRSEGIPLDHGRLAVDLEGLQGPATADGVRLRWGRDYYARAQRPTDGQEQAATGTTTTTDQEEAR